MCIIIDTQAHIHYIYAIYTLYMYINTYTIIQFHKIIIFIIQSKRTKNIFKFDII